MECAWKTVVLIPKEGGLFRGFLWKVFTGFINYQIGAAVQFHDMLHGFRAGWLMRTVSLKAKLIQPLI